MAKFLVGAALEEFINPSMYIDSISLVAVFCIASQCVCLILVISIRWFQNILVVFQDMFDDLQSFPAYVPLISNQVVPKILVFLIVFLLCLNRFAIYTSMVCNDFPLVFLWFSVNLNDFLMFHPKILVFFETFKQNLNMNCNDLHWFSEDFLRFFFHFRVFFHRLWLKNVCMPGSVLLTGAPI